MRKTLAVTFKTGTNINKQMLYEQGGTTRGINLYIEDGQLYLNAWNKANDDNGATTPWGPSCSHSSPDTVYSIVFTFDQIIESALNSTILLGLKSLGW